MLLAQNLFISMLFIHSLVYCVLCNSIPNEKNGRRVMHYIPWKEFIAIFSFRLGALLNCHVYEGRDELELLNRLNVHQSSMRATMPALSRVVADILKYFFLVPRWYSPFCQHTLLLYIPPKHTPVQHRRATVYCLQCRDIDSQTQRETQKEMRLTH